MFYLGPLVTFAYSFVYLWFSSAVCTECPGFESFFKYLNDVWSMVGTSLLGHWITECSTRILTVKWGHFHLMSHGFREVEGTQKSSKCLLASCGIGWKRSWKESWALYPSKRCCGSWTASGGIPQMSFTLLLPYLGNNQGFSQNHSYCLLITVYEIEPERCWTHLFDILLLR